MKVRFGVAKRGAAQCQKSLHIPGQQRVLVGVEIYREVEEIRDVRNSLAVLGRSSGLQYVDPLDDENVGTIDLDPLIGNGVVKEVRIDGRAYRISGKPLRSIKPSRSRLALG